MTEQDLVMDSDILLLTDIIDTQDRAIARLEMALKAICDLDAAMGHGYANALYMQRIALRALDDLPALLALDDMPTEDDA